MAYVLTGAKNSWQRDVDCMSRYNLTGAPPIGDCVGVDIVAVLVGAVVVLPSLTN